jgi:hypothetical protein
MKNTVIYFLLFITFGCNPTQSQNFEIVSPLPKKIKEASACQVVKGSDLVWTIEDQKNDNILFGFTKDGKIKREIRIVNVENNDWEDLSSDEKGNVYIGDFGNNDNERQNLAIYKINHSDLDKDEAKASEIIEFYYPEQKEFPPKKKDKIYDVESFFYFQNAFYLFTKNRSSKFDGTTTLYKVENKTDQKQAAKKIATFQTCNSFNHCAVTSAAISADEKKVALLTSDKVYLFTEFNGDNFFSGKNQMIPLEHFSQKEGICFEDNNNLLITDEAMKKGGSFLYILKF